jgi:hypothetical protein
MERIAVDEDTEMLEPKLHNKDGWAREMTRSNQWPLSLDPGLETVRPEIESKTSRPEPCRLCLTVREMNQILKAADISESDITVLLLTILTKVRLSGHSTPRVTPRAII